MTQLLPLEAEHVWHWGEHGTHTELFNQVPAEQFVHCKFCWQTLHPEVHCPHCLAASRKNVALQVLHVVGESHTKQLGTEQLTQVTMGSESSDVWRPPFPHTVQFVADPTHRAHGCLQLSHLAAAVKYHPKEQLVQLSCRFTQLSHPTLQFLHNLRVASL
jgi:hypothetical protein